MDKKPPRPASVAALPSYIFDSKDVIRLVGIPATSLNKFIERSSFGIGPSLRPGYGRGSRRLFGWPDVYAVALVWWLFRAGLRSQVIGQILKKLTRAENPLSEKPASEVVTHLLGEHVEEDSGEMLVIRRRLASGGKKTQDLSVRLEFGAVNVRGSEAESVHVVPLGNLLQRLTEKIRKVRPNFDF